MPSAAVIREKINRQIIAALEKGTPPWIRPWKNVGNAPGIGRHHNFMTPRRPYHGINVMLLELSAMASDWTSTAWGTMYQWNKFDCHVRKGEHGTKVILWKRMNTPRPADELEDGSPRNKQWLLMREYVVFNAEQIVGSTPLGEKVLDRFRVKPEPETPTEPLPPDYATAEAIIDACQKDGMIIKQGGNRACWQNGTELIRVPKQSQFPTPSHWFETVFHEMGHWTELKRHTDWDRVKWGYAMGELRAELICCYLRQHSNIPLGEGLENHTAYISTWLEQMKKDDKWIFHATRFADAGTNCILKIAGMEEAITEEPESEETPTTPPATTTSKPKGRRKKSDKAA